MERIREDLSGLVDDHAMFEEFREVIQANGPWIDELEGGIFVEFIKRGYVAQTVLGIRRHLKSKDDSISLRRLLEQMRECAPQVTFEFYLQRHPAERERTPWQKPTFGRFSADGDTLSRDLIDADLAALKSLSGDIEGMADKTLAHLDKAGFAGVVRFKDLREAVDTFNKLTCKYLALLLAEGYFSLEATIMMNWQNMFRNAWDRRPA